MRKLNKRDAFSNSLVFCCLLILSFHYSCSDSVQKQALLKLLQNKIATKNIAISYPFNNTQFPPEFPSPTFEWKDSTGTINEWHVYITDISGTIYLFDKVKNQTKWRPDSVNWLNLKKLTKQGHFYFSVIGGITADKANDISSAKVELCFSRDSVGADIFFRAVTLPFSYAVKNVHTIEWYMGSVKGGRPHKLLDNMPVCANCHSFSGNGSSLAMDVDYGNDKGSYAISPTHDTCKLTPENIITWSDYKRVESEPTFGLLSQISPDGKFVLSTVKDLSVFVAVDNNMAYSQLFFPIKGIIGVYDRQNKTFSELPGANDRKLVQSNPSWSPDGKRVIFASTEAYISQRVKKSGKALLSTKDIEEFFSGGKEFKFNLNSIAFNQGKGGISKPLEGASFNGKSNYFAKFSPDGKWIVFCQAANFMLLQPDSKLYIMPADGSSKPRLMLCNLDSMNSWHSWSPNGRWLVFSSKHRGIYTQLYLTHIDEKGNDSPPVLLENLLFEKRAANIPEFFPGNSNDFKNIKDAFSNTAPSYSAIASDNITNKYFKRAWDNLQKAITIDSSYAEAYFSRIMLNAQLLQSNSIVDRADKRKLLALTSKPNKDDDFHTAVLHATLVSSSGDNHAALEEANQLLLKFPNTYQIYEFIASVLRKSKNFEAVIPYYDKMAKLVPANEAQLNYLKASAYIAMGKYSIALGILNELIKKNPYDYDLCATRVRIYIENKAFELALKDCDYILSKDADNYKYYQLRAQVFVKLGAKRDASKDYKTSLQLITKEYSKNQEDITLLFEKASLLEQMGSSQEAIADYDKILSIFPNNYEALRQKARFQTSQQLWGEAIHSYILLASNYPEEEEFHNNQAIAYLNLGNQSKALDELNKTLQINNENCDALYNRAKLKKMMGNVNGSKDDFNTVIRILTGKKNRGQLSDRDLQWLNSLKQTPI